MEKLGIKFSDADFLKRSIDKAGICVLHAFISPCHEKCRPNPKRVSG
jgi:hypothetical protein